MQERELAMSGVYTTKQATLLMMLYVILPQDLHPHNHVLRYVQEEKTVSQMRVWPSRLTAGTGARGVRVTLLRTRVVMEHVRVQCGVQTMLMVL